MALTRYSIETANFRRANPDNTPATPERNIGFSGTIDSTTPPFTLNAVDLTIKIDSAPPETQSVDFIASPPTDTAAVTVAEAVIAINAAGFTDITASEDATTGRLLIVYSGASTPNYMQIYGDGADVFDFGQGQTFGGANLGTKIFNHIDNAKGLTDALNLKEAEEVENEAGDGTLVIVRKSEKVKGSAVVYTSIDQDNEFLHLVMGGTYDNVTGQFTMPTVLQSEMPKITAESYTEQYAKGSHLEGSTAGYTHKVYALISGVRGDEANEAGSLAEGVYNFASLQYTDAAELLTGHMYIVDISNEDYLNLDIENLGA